MDQQKSKKRVACSSSSPSKRYGLRRRRTNSPPSSPDVPVVDSGFLETFLIDEKSNHTIELDSPTFNESLQSVGEILGDSPPIALTLRKMSVDSNPRKPSFAALRKIESIPPLSVRKKKSENFVSGQSLIKHPEDPHAASGSSAGREFGHRRFSAAIRDLSVPCSFNKENAPGYRRDPHLFEHHPHLEANMRSVLLEWIIEVCKAHYLQRKTYHLAMDYTDRFLSLTKNLPKTTLQLLGVSALSIAAKIEEIFPPKLSEMAYVTDGAHDENEIKQMEKLIFSVLGTALMPVTTGEWVAKFLHQAGYKGFSEAGSNRRVERTECSKISVENQLPLELYSKICRVIDLAMLDADSLQFSYRQIATGAISIVDSSGDIIRSLVASGDFDETSIGVCTSWMTPFSEMESTLGPVVVSCPAHTHQIQLPLLQSHDFNMEIFKRALEWKNHVKENAALTDVASEETTDMLHLNYTLLEEAPLPSSSSTAVTTPNRVLTNNSWSFLTPPDSQIKLRRPH